MKHLNFLNVLANLHLRLTLNLFSYMLICARCTISSVN